MSSRNSIEDKDEKDGAWEEFLENQKELDPEFEETFKEQFWDFMA